MGLLLWLVVSSDGVRYESAITTDPPVVDSSAEVGKITIRLTDNDREMADNPPRSQETYPDVYYDNVKDFDEGDVADVLDHYSLPEDSPLSRVVAVLRYVVTQIPWRERTGETPLREYEEIVRFGGNCEEQSIVLASLLSTIPGAGIRFVTVEGDSVGGHALLEVYIPHTDSDNQATRMRRICNQTPEINVYPGRISWEHDDGRDWLVADPTSCR